MADEQTPQSAAPASIPIIDDSGNWGTIAPEEANHAVQNHGFRIPSPQEVQDHALEKQYGTGLANEVETAAEEAASVGTFGMSRQLENITGLTTPQAQAARAKFNPASRIAGGALPVIATLGAEAPEAAAGAAAEAATPGVLGAVGGAARAIPGVEALSKPISALTTGAESLAGTIPELGAGRAAQLTTGALRGTAAGALAGGTFGLGNAISEDALGDPDALGEHLLQNVGIGALWGGVPGGILGALHEAIPGVAKEAADATAATQDSIATATGAPKPGLFGKGLAAVSAAVSGAPQSEIEYAIANKARALVSPEQFVAQAEDLTKNLQDQYDLFSKLTKTANSDLRPAETEQALSQLNPAPAKELWLDQLGKIDDAAKQMRAEPSLFSQFYPAYLEKLVNDSVSKISDSSSAFDVFNALDEMKGKIDDNLIHYGANVAPEQQQAENIARGLRLGLKQGLESQDVFGEAGSRQAEFNDAQNSYLKQIGKKGLFRKFFTSQITTKSGKLIDRVDPGKVQTYLRNLGTLTGDDKAQALQGFMDASHNLLGQVQKTYESLPNSAVDLETARNSLTNNVNKISETTEQGKFNKIMGRLGGGAHNAQLGELAAGYTAVHNPALGAAIEGWNMARAPALAIRRYAQISKASASVASAIKKGAASVFGGASQAAESASSIIPSLSGLIGSQNPEWSEAKNKVEGIRNIAGNVSALSDRLSSSTQHLANEAPKTSVGLMSAATRATSYLNSILPPASPQYLMDNPKDVSLDHQKSWIEHSKSSDSLSPHSIGSKTVRSAQMI